MDSKLVDEDLFVSGGVEDIYATHEEYVPPFVEPGDVIKSAEAEDELEEGDIPSVDEVFGAELVFYDDVWLLMIEWL